MNTLKARLRPIPVKKPVDPLIQRTIDAVAAFQRGLELIRREDRSLLKVDPTPLRMIDELFDDGTVVKLYVPISEPATNDLTFTMPNDLAPGEKRKVECSRAPGTFITVERPL